MEYAYTFTYAGCRYKLEDISDYLRQTGFVPEGGILYSLIQDGVPVISVKGKPTSSENDSNMEYSICTWDASCISNNDLRAENFLLALEKVWKEYFKAEGDFWECCFEPFLGKCIASKKEEDSVLAGRVFFVGG